MARDPPQQVVDQGLEVRLLTDGAKIGFGHQLLMVSLDHRGRARAMGWTWVRVARGHSSATKQQALLACLRGLFPVGAAVTIAADSEFGAVAVPKQSAQWQWGYVMPQKRDACVQLTDQHIWLRFDSLAQKSACPRWLADAQLTRKHGYTVDLVARWKAGEREPWLLATSSPTLRDGLRTYKRRPWIEEMFDDFKKHGSDLERSHLRHILRPSRLILIVTLLYVWSAALGSQVIKRGQRHPVDRADRRDLSIFGVSLSSVGRLPVNDQPSVLRLAPCFW